MDIIINGGTSGIGKELALLFAADSKNSVFVTGRNEASLKDLAGSHNNIITMRIDLADFDSQAVSFKNTVLAHFSSIDILVNMAGLLITSDFESSTNEEARQMMETNFIGPATVIRILKPFMKKGSHIVNISSMGGFQGSSKYKGLAYYSASKAAISVLTECLANEFFNSEISVNCLAIGAVQTKMFQDAFPGFKAPVEAGDMAKFISDFALGGHKFFNGKILPVAVNNP